MNRSRGLHVVVAGAMLVLTVSVGWAAPVILDPGFEFPVQPDNQWKQAGGAGSGTLVGANWTFSSSAGISRNVSAFQGGGVTAPEGSQLALIQQVGSISQTLSGFEPGKLYQITLAQRTRSGSGPNDIQVRVGGQLVGQGLVNDMPFADYSTSFFTVSSATPQLEFQTTNPKTGDKTTFLDNVRVAEVTVSGPTLTNPGFESGATPPSPGYGIVDGWVASNPVGMGVNAAGGPFLNGLTAPEGARIGFIQYSGSLSQLIAGLTPGQRYQLVYLENERGNGTSPIAQGSATLDGNTIVPLHNVTRRAAFSNVHSLPFTAGASSSALVVSNTSGANDNTLLLDNFSLRLLDGPLVGDSGFENPVQAANTWKQANGAGTGTLAGSAWTFAGGAGITRNFSAFQNGNIPAPEGVQHALLQNAGSSMTQTITGFTPGTQYQIDLLAMARQTGAYGNDLEAVLDAGLPTEVKILDLSEVTYNRFTEVLGQAFLAYKDSYVLTLRATGNGGLLTGDRTTFIDDVQFFTTVPEPCTLVLAAMGLMGLGRYVRRRR